MHHGVNYSKMLLITNDFIYMKKTGQVKQEVRFFKEDKSQRIHTHKSNLMIIDFV